MATYGEQYAIFDEAPYIDVSVLVAAEATAATDFVAEMAAMEQFEAQRNFGQGVLAVTGV